MSAFVPPPSRVVVPLPMPTMVAVPPTSAPSSPNAAVAAAPNGVKPGGVALDMSNIFGPPKNVAKQSLPPWVRKKLDATHCGSSPSAENLTPPPESVAVRPKSPLVSAVTAPALAAGLPNTLVQHSNAGATDPSQPSLPPAADVLTQPVGNAPVAVTRKSLSSESLITSSAPAAPLPSASVMGSGDTAAPSAPPPPPPAAVPPPPPGRPVVEVAPSCPDSTTAPFPPVSFAASPLPRTLPDAPTPPPAPVAAAACASELPPPASGVHQSPTVAAAATLRAVQSAMPASSPTPITTTSHIVQDPMHGSRPRLPTPTVSVIAPHVVFQGQEQMVVVSPLAPVPPGEGKKVPSPAVGSAGNWYNRYDLQPSPSAGFAQHCGSGPLVTSTTRQQWTSSAVINSAKPKSNWRETYWQHVDVHRYVARRYFGAPPPLEQ
ncbi:hypothetical protein GH5_02325 [Leishmania sp. Ghana 2012 LV757]|uniref:hypothetical protein n=1 Tax=Leishmania sp. Ghana 2012 LV757 TaxID=2803181 RepID=UPI001B625EFE|nr:hypothetical protein GH5_02325 [Leishmania sp. Ghana 2012 LV757]